MLQGNGHGKHWMGHLYNCVMVTRGGRLGMECNMDSA